MYEVVLTTDSGREISRNVRADSEADAIDRVEMEFPGCSIIRVVGPWAISPR